MRRSPLSSEFDETSLERESETMTTWRSVIVKSVVYAIVTLLTTFILGNLLLLAGFTTILVLFWDIVLFETGFAFTISTLYIGFGSSPTLARFRSTLLNSKLEIRPQEETFKDGILFFLTGIWLFMAPLLF